MTEATRSTATAVAPLSLSTASGATDVPLIEQTIGAFFNDMVQRQPDHEALVSVHQGRRLTYRALQRGLRVDEVPIVFVDRRAGESKMSRRIFAEAVGVVWRLRLQALRGEL